MISIVVCLNSSEKASRQSLIAPTPGSTILSAVLISSGSEVTNISSLIETSSRALLTECRFPMP